MIGDFPTYIYIIFVMLSSSARKVKLNQAMLVESVTFESEFN